MAKEQEKPQENPAKELNIVGLKAENEQLKKQIVELQEKLADKAPPKIKGFLLEVDDPFGAGAIRAYRKVGGKSNQADRLPFVLPEKEEASKAALENYILRADGGADKIRAAVARKALEQAAK